MGGDWHGSYGTVPAPGHSREDRSVSIRPHYSDSDVVIHSFAGEDPLVIKGELRRRGLLPERSNGFRPQGPWRAVQEAASAASEAEEVRKRREIAHRLWQRSQAIGGTLAERYLREARKITDGELPPTLRFVPASAKYPPTLVAAFGLPDEPEPGVLRIEPTAIRGVHTTWLRSDGSGKADVGGESAKKRIGKGPLPPIVLAPVTDGLGLTITEGIEDALTIHMLRDTGVWAAGSALQLPGLAEHVPAYVACITVYIDADPAGERYGRALVWRLRAKGFEVIIRPWARVRYGQA
jgi:hypothetical protein